MLHLAYDALTSLALLPGAGYLVARSKHRALLGRFAPRAPEGMGARPIWVQACSMGEVNASGPVLEAMARRWPETPLLLTTSTISGRQQSEAKEVTVPVTWFPFDHRVCVQSFLRRIRPRMLVLLETEVWPNAVSLARRHGIPVAILNGRLSDKHFARYLRLRRFWRPVFGALSAACAQNDEYADRFHALGANLEAIHVTGCTKFDGVRTEFPAHELEVLRHAVGIPAESPVLVFGSMRPGDEILAAECWATLRAQYPELRLVLVPRHIERARDVCAPFAEPLLLRSETLRGRIPAGERVVTVDVMGELVAFYAMATVAVIGGSFYPGVEGHNPLESAALGIPTVFGPYMRNFVDPSAALLRDAGAAQTRAEELPQTLQELLGAPERREGIASRGRGAVLANQGAIGRSLDVLESLLPFI